MKKIRLLLLIVYCCFTSKVMASSEDVAMVLSGATTAFGAIYAGSIHDIEGINQLAHSVFLSSAATTLLKYSINRRRPDGRDQRSFPSGHTSLAFTGATFVNQRYGWAFGIPMFIAASATAYQRVDSDKHDFWDVLGGAIIGITSSVVHTSRYGEIYPSYNQSTMMLNYRKNF